MLSVSKSGLFKGEGGWLNPVPTSKQQFFLHRKQSLSRERWEPETWNIVRSPQTSNMTMTWQGCNTNFWLTAVPSATRCLYFGLFLAEIQLYDKESRVTFTPDFLDLAKWNMRKTCIPSKNCYVEAHCHSWPRGQVLLRTGLIICISVCKNTRSHKKHVIYTHLWILAVTEYLELS